MLGNVIVGSRFIFLYFPPSESELLGFIRMSVKYARLLHAILIESNYCYNTAHLIVGAGTVIDLEKGARLHIRRYKYFVCLL